MIIVSKRWTHFGRWAACSLLASGCGLFPAESPAEPAPSPEPVDNTEVVMTPLGPPPMLEPEQSSAAAASPEPIEPGVHETSEQTRGRLPPAKITPVLARHSEQFTKCYADVVQAEPIVAGRVTLLIVITTDGSVGHAEVLHDRSTLQHAGVHACLVAEARTLQFEKPVGGRVVTEYPLDFKPVPGGATVAPSETGPEAAPAKPSLPAKGTE